MTTVLFQLWFFSYSFSYSYTFSISISLIFSVTNIAVILPFQLQLQLAEESLADKDRKLQFRILCCWHFDNYFSF